MQKEPFFKENDDILEAFYSSQRVEFSDWGKEHFSGTKPNSTAKSIDEIREGNQAKHKYTNKLTPFGKKVAGKLREARTKR